MVHYILQSLNPGEDVEFLAPAGQFVLKDDSVEEKIVFVATGSGISAIRSMILDLLQSKQDKRQIHLHWGLRYAQDIFWEDEWHALETSFDNFHFDVVLSKAPEGWPLCQGHVNECLKHHYKDYSKTGYYLCGNTRMVKEVSEYLESNGASSNNVHYEKFY